MDMGERIAPHARVAADGESPPTCGRIGGRRPSVEVSGSAERPLSVQGAVPAVPHRKPSNQQAWRRLRNPIGALGGVIVAVVILMALLAGVLAPFDPTSQLAQPLQAAGRRPTRSAPTSSAATF